MARVTKDERALRALIVEDSEDDAELIALELRRAGFSPAYERVAEPAALREALSRQAWDVVLSDHVMPGFSSMEVLDILREQGTDTPCLIVSGAIGEEAAVSLLRGGAVDYVNKARLERLGPAVTRALRESETERARREAEKALALAHQEAEAHLSQLRAVIASMGEALVIVDASGALVTMNPAALRLYGYPDLEAAKRALRDSPASFEVFDLEGNPVSPEQWPLARALRGESYSGLELRVRYKGSERSWIGSHSGTPVRDADGKVTLAVVTARDVTEKVQAEEARRKEELERMLAVRSAEARRRIGRELHDGLQQQLVGMRMLTASLHKSLEKLELDEAAQMEEFGKLLGQANTQVRRLIHGLVPHSVEADSLLPALRRAAANIEQWYGVPVELHCKDDIIVKDDETADHLFNIAQEAVTNAAKHSRASKIEIIVDSDDGMLSLEVCDDGGGMPPDFEKRGGMGLLNMRYRAELAGADLRIHRGERGGTTVTCMLAQVPVGAGR